MLELAISSQKVSMAGSMCLANRSNSLPKQTTVPHGKKLLGRLFTLTISSTRWTDCNSNWSAHTRVAKGRMLRTHSQLAQLFRNMSKHDSPSSPVPCWSAFILLRAKTGLSMVTWHTHGYTSAWSVPTLCDGSLISMSEMISQIFPETSKFLGV